MFTLKTYQLPFFNGEEIETQIRKVCSKSLVRIDLANSTSYVGSEKKFVGYETNSNLQITRIRGPIEMYFPKLILCFEKQIGFQEYKIRFSLVSTVLLTFLSLFGLTGFLQCLWNAQFGVDLVVSFLFNCSIIFVVWLEFKLTARALHKILKP